MSRHPAVNVIYVTGTGRLSHLILPYYEIIPTSRTWSVMSPKAGHPPGRETKYFPLEKRIINPWTWSENFGYAQAVEVKHAESTLYCAGQAAVHPDGTFSDADMRTQMKLALENLEAVIRKADYELKNIVRITLYSTSDEELFTNNAFEIFLDWVAKHEIRAAATAMEVSKLTGSLCIEFEATVVK